MNIKMEQMRPDVKFCTLFSLELFVCHENTMVITKGMNIYNGRYTIQLKLFEKLFCKLRFQ